MKFTGVTFTIAAFAAGAASQSLSSLPSCAISCATDSIPSDCGLDVKCICSAQSFISGVSCCIADACNADDQKTTIEYADKICAGVGVSNLPTSAVCSSTASATGGSKTSSAGESQTAATATASTTSAGSSSETSTAASPSGTNAATSFTKADGSVTAGVMVAAVFAAMCLA
ncbi:uncharacterized protein TRUGW13939_09811 [Talaromyces rugulosus]|uniref:CFEM domain-containing protein n=1 Tax=Talaromyces rugulosus TaxID=121627 RepID=A0A7H8R8C7_TALRU|nr:uncharacterized protein TRUGW13939_09811 [Talaromyces rugulosus]QKX62650.1 hypothetical protein TRUGW13939_09811 [Talaromyces rugulosus]